MKNINKKIQQHKGWQSETVKRESNFQPLEVVDRGCETQPQVVENFTKR